MTKQEIIAVLYDLAEEIDALGDTSGGADPTWLLAELIAAVMDTGPEQEPS